MHFDYQFKQVLCTDCGRLGEPGDIACDRCGGDVSILSDQELLRYAAEAYYYGFQYRIAYEKKSGPNAPKYSLTFGGEAFVWVVLAMLSGIIGNASYDAVKRLARDLRDQAKQKAEIDRSYDRLANMTDPELERMYEFTRDYCAGLEAISTEIRAKIQEEIVADCLSQSPLREDFMQLAMKKKREPEDQDRAIEILRKALEERRNRLEPKESRFRNFWRNFRDDG